MRKSILLLGVLGLLLVSVTTAGATSVYLYADTAPNAYGSPNFAPWRTAAFAAAANGTFVNMASGAHPGTTTFEPLEAIVYSGGDLGQRLHWVYWIPGETLTTIAGRFQAKDVVDWDGVDYAGGAVEDGPEVGWFTPGSWINYDANGDTVTDGVIGTFGNAWWPPYTPQDISATAADMLTYQTHWTGVVRFKDTAQSDWQLQQLRLDLVPEPGSIFALLSGLGGLAIVRRRR